jgi:transcriptional regulator with XRE-family HTH domain
MNQHRPAQTSLGAYLRAQRENSGLTMRQLAAMVGVHYSYIAKLEADERAKPSVELLQNLAEALELDDPAELLAFVDVTMPAPRIYFRRAYGLTDQQAAEAERWIEQQFGNTPRQTGALTSPLKEVEREQSSNIYCPAATRAYAGATAE